jgi:hypothetical protein
MMPLLFVADVVPLCAQSLQHPNSTKGNIMAEIFDTLLLLALPASGKSEVRKYLESKNPEQFHMGQTVQLDDYPYVHLQIRIDEELHKMGLPPLYHTHDSGPFIEGWNWGSLIQLLNEDYHEVRLGKAENPEFAARRLFERLDQASVRAGGIAKIGQLPSDIQDKLAEVMEAEARKLFDEKAAQIPADLKGKTIVIEFARGGPEGASMPLRGGYGYIGSLSQLSAEILERAVILYIWVAPEESRRKNRARARPGAQDSILFHGTPEEVMFKEYGCDDMEYLMSQARANGTIPIDIHGKTFDIPIARFDNRVDKTSFLREEPEHWKQSDIDALHQGIKVACDQLWQRYSQMRRIP